MSDPTDHVKLGKEAYALANRGVAHQQEGNYSEAIADFTKVLDLLSKTGGRMLHYYGGNCRLCENRRVWPSSSAATPAPWSMCGEGEDCNAYVYHYRGLSYLGERAYDQAIADLTKAIDSRNCPRKESYEARSEAYFGRGQKTGNVDDQRVAEADELKARANNYFGTHSFTVRQEISQVREVIRHFFATSDWGEWQVDTKRNTDNHLFFRRGVSSRPSLHEYRYWLDALTTEAFNRLAGIPCTIRVTLRPEPEGTSVEMTHRFDVPHPTLPVWAYVCTAGTVMILEGLLLKEARSAYNEMSRGTTFNAYGLGEALACETYLREMAKPTAEKSAGMDARHSNS